MRLVIRADASLSVGTGHVMRSSTIAAEFVNLGHTVCYVGKIDPMDLILERFHEIGVGYPVLLPKDFDPCNKSDILLIDSYTLKPSDPFIAREKWFRTCSISDSVTPNFNVDLVIKPSLKTQPNSNHGVRVLTGTSYMLLRNSIAKNFPRKLDDSSLLRILIVGGGSDPSSFCNEVTKAIQGLSSDFTADIFSDNVDLTLSADSRIRIHKVSLSMDRFADNCDLALTLASSLSLELIAREIPTGIAYAFENQKSGFIEMVSLGFAAPIGGRDKFGKWIFDMEILEQLITSELSRNELRSRISGLIDMRGPERVALEILRL